MKRKLFFVCLFGVLMLSGLIMTGCSKDCDEQTGCHGIVENGVFTGTASCGRLMCVVETLRTSGIQNSGGFVFCNCED